MTLTMNPALTNALAPFSGLNPEIGNGAAVLWRIPTENPALTLGVSGASDGSLEGMEGAIGGYGQATLDPAMGGFPTSATVTISYAGLGGVPDAKLGAMLRTSPQQGSVVEVNEPHPQSTRILTPLSASFPTSSRTSSCSLAPSPARNSVPR